MRSGRLTQEEAEAHPQRSVITRALGTDSHVDVDTIVVEAAPGDVFLLCSDGLTTMLPDEVIAGTVEAAASVDEAVRELVRGANRGGGEDNITVVAFEVAGDEALEETLAAPPPPGTADESELEDTLTDLPPVVPVAQVEESAPRPRRKRRRWGRRAFWGLTGLAFVALVLGGALFGLSRAYFVGADADGNVVVYQGVPFDLRDGVGFYRERYVSELQASQLSEEERADLFNHALVSYDRARARVAVYEAEALP
jgi:protein phosphatase